MDISTSDGENHVSEDEIEDDVMEIDPDYKTWGWDPRKFYFQGGRKRGWDPRFQSMEKNWFRRCRGLWDGDYQPHYRTNKLRKDIQRVITKHNNATDVVDELNQVLLGKDGAETELCDVLLELCGEEAGYNPYYDDIAERLCKDESHQEYLEKCFVIRFQEYRRPTQYERRRTQENVAVFFACLLARDAISWRVFKAVRLSEKNDNHPSHSFLRVLFRKLGEIIEIRKLKNRIEDSSVCEYFQSILPLDNARNTKYAIKFFTDIGLEGICDNLRKYLMKRKYVKFSKVRTVRLESDSSSSESDSGYSDEEDDKKKKRQKKPRNNHISIGGS